MKDKLVGLGLQENGRKYISLRMWWTFSCIFLLLTSFTQVLEILKFLASSLNSFQIDLTKAANMIVVSLLKYRNPSVAVHFFKLQVQNPFQDPKAPPGLSCHSSHLFALYPLLKVSNYFPRIHQFSYSLLHLWECSSSPNSGIISCEKPLDKNHHFLHLPPHPKIWASSPQWAAAMRPPPLYYNFLFHLCLTHQTVSRSRAKTWISSPL